MLTKRGKPLSFEQFVEKQFGIVLTKKQLILGHKISKPLNLLFLGCYTLGDSQCKKRR